MIYSYPQRDTSVSFPATSKDAFGRLRISQPYTLFDSTNRYAIDNQFDSAVTGTGAVTHLTNESSASLSVTSGGVGSVVRQSYRSFPYQPGKGLFVITTFVMDGSSSSNLTQRVGYFNTNNGVFFQNVGSTLSFVLRSSSTPTPGTPSDTRAVAQSSWNGDKLDGTGSSGYTLDPSKAQILWMDFEWLGCGSVRCGFVINGEFIVCHTFHNANSLTTVYMTTATLPIRWEITSTSAMNADLQQICSSVISEGGYEQTSIDHVARRTTSLTGISTTFVPIVSIRLNSSALGAVVLPNRIQVLPLTADTFEYALVKNPTLSGASWSSVSSDANVQYDVSATSYSGGTIFQNDYVVSTSRSIGSGNSPIGYNWDLQLGVSIAGVSDIYTLGIRTISGTGTAIGSFSFYDLSQ